MAYDEGLAQRVREVLAGKRPVSEMKMFGGLGFMLNGHLACGIAGDTLMVRVDPAGQEQVWGEPHAGPMVFPTRTVSGFAVVQPQGIATRKALETWVGRGLAYVGTLPPKPPKGAKAERQAKVAEPKASGRAKRPR